MIVSRIEMMVSASNSLSLLKSEIMPGKKMAMRTMLRASGVILTILDFCWMPGMPRKRETRIKGIRK